MNLECKYVNNFSINSRKAVLLCGFVVFVLLFSALISLETVRSSDDNSENEKEVSAEETGNLINQKREEIKQVQNKINVAKNMRPKQEPVRKPNKTNHCNRP